MPSCDYCGRDVSPRAHECPHCGEPEPSSSPTTDDKADGDIFSGALFVILGIWVAWCPYKFHTVSGDFCILGTLFVVFPCAIFAWGSLVILCCLGRIKSVLGGSCGVVVAMSS